MQAARERKPDLMLLDVMMPSVDGLDVCRILRAESQIPIVLLTSSALQEEMLRAYVDGANSFLQKPVDFDHFDELIRQVGYYWVHLNQNPEQITLVADVEPEEEMAPTV